MTETRAVSGRMDLSSRCKIERAVGVHGEESYFATLLFEEGAMVDDGGMLDGGGQDVALAGMGGQGAVQGGVVAFRAATGEDDFLGVGIEEGGDFGARLFDLACPHWLPNL